MRPLVLLFIMFWALQMLQGRVKAQSPDAVFAEIETAIKKGDSQMLANYFNNILEINLIDKEQTYSQNQAMFVMKEFFMNYPVKSFSILHKGQSGENIYAVGSYISVKGAFDTNIFIKKYNGNFKINQLRFEPDK